MGYIVAREAGTHYALIYMSTRPPGAPHIYTPRDEALHVVEQLVHGTSTMLEGQKHLHVLRAADGGGFGGPCVLHALPVKTIEHRAESRKHLDA